ncbi:MAG TPA: type ISP restriction/modification enzyme, partial [Ktedonobacteraceae bacterium]|nr:type ISP restriction/modification enzyme [Ktedonobacteraceae bacterium]
MVVLGNPPYSGHSANKALWIKDLLRGQDSQTGAKTGNYFEVDGQPLRERNPKWLNDDYVKFMRFAQWRIEKTGYGILAFITNHGYLDNPTFRGMRQSLMQTFDDIYVLDLHGNSKKKERSPDGSKDENVFDIQQGVAIGIFVKRQKKASVSSMANVYHTHLWGEREVYEGVREERKLVEGKYYWLAENDMTTTHWEKLEPDRPLYLFIPQNISLRDEYEGGRKLTEIMSVNVLGFQSHRDSFAISFDKETLRARIDDMCNQSLSDQELAERYNLSSNSIWNMAEARKKLCRDSERYSHIIPCFYRPLDKRYCCFSVIVMDRPRAELKQHMLQPNLSLNVPRQTKAQSWQHAIAANTPTPALFTEIKDGSNVFPLYLYPDPIQGNLLDTDGGRRPNLSSTFVNDIANHFHLKFVSDGKGDLQQTFGPEDIFNYMYAVFHSPNYCERYAEFLKIDFPRLPLTSNADLFRELCQLGDRLVGLHLMEKFGKITTRYPVSGNDVVEKIDYTSPADAPEQGRVWINKTQYIEGVP